MVIHSQPPTLGATITGAALCALFVAMAGCATSRPSVDASCASMKLTAVSVPSQQIDFPLAGFSVTPPQGEHWCISDKDSTKGILFSTGAALGRRFDARPSPQTMSNTLGAAAVVVDPGEWKVDTPEGLRAFAEYRIREEPGRFRRREALVSPEAGFGAECVRANQVVEERHNPGAPGAVLIMVNRQVFCRHPDSPRRVILIGVSERYLEGDPGPRLVDLRKDQIDGFAQSLKFTPLR